MVSLELLALGLAIFPSGIVSYQLCNKYLSPKQPRMSVSALLTTAIFLSIAKFTVPWLSGSFLVVIIDYINTFALISVFLGVYLFWNGGKTTTDCAKYAAVILLSMAVPVLVQSSLFGKPILNCLRDMTQITVWSIMVLSLFTAHIYASIGLFRIPSWLMQTFSDKLGQEKNIRFDLYKANMANRDFYHKYVYRGMKIPANLKPMEQKLRDNELEARDKYETFKNKQTIAKWISAGLQFCAGLLVAVFALAMFCFITADAAERTFESDCYFQCGFSDRKTLSQTIIQDLEQYTGFYSFPIVMLIYYLACAVAGVIYSHDVYKNEGTDVKYIVLIGCIVIFASYSGAGVVASLAPHRWPEGLVGQFITFASGWMFSCTVVAHEFYQNCVKCGNHEQYEQKQ